MSVGQMSVGQMSVGQMVFDQLERNPWDNFYPSPKFFQLLKAYNDKGNFNFWPECLPDQYVATTVSKLFRRIIKLIRLGKWISFFKLSWSYRLQTPKVSIEPTKPFSSSSLLITRNYKKASVPRKPIHLQPSLIFHFPLG